VLAQVENNARVGAFMLALREATQSALPPDLVQSLAATRQVSWPIAGVFAGLFLLAPSWLARGGRPRRWQNYGIEGHCKDV
jgi:hypothetical protein